MLDIGAGTGALTAALLGREARVVAFELHPQRARVLRRRFAGARFTVVQADAADLRLPRRPFRVVANPPFGITTALLRRLLSSGSRLATADLVVPRYVATRWSAPGAPAFPRWSRTFTASVTRGLPGRAFRPPPPGPVSLLHLERRRATS